MEWSASALFNIVLTFFSLAVFEPLMVVLVHPSDYTRFNNTYHIIILDEMQSRRGILSGKAYVHVKYRIVVCALMAS